MKSREEASCGSAMDLMVKYILLKKEMG